MDVVQTHLAQRILSGEQPQYHLTHGVKHRLLPKNHLIGNRLIRRFTTDWGNQTQVVNTYFAVSDGQSIINPLRKLLYLNCAFRVCLHMHAGNYSACFFIISQCLHLDEQSTCTAYMMVMQDLSLVISSHF